MGEVYPAILTMDDNLFFIYIPDIDKSVAGEDFYQAIQLARQAIKESDGHHNPSTLEGAISKAVAEEKLISPAFDMSRERQVVTRYLFIDVDIDADKG